MLIAVTPVAEIAPHGLTRQRTISNTFTGIDNAASDTSSCVDQEEYMKSGKLLSITFFSLLFAWVGTPAQAQWLPQPPTGSGPIYYTGGNVGIGTSVPSYFLHVVWNLNATQSQIVLQNTNSGTNAGADLALLNDVPLPLTTVTQPSISAALSSRATVNT